MRILRTVLKKVKAAVLSPFNAHLNTVSVIPQPYKKPLTLLRYTNPMRRKQTIIKVLQKPQGKN